MLTLIMREIEDNRVFFLAALLLAGILSGVVVWQQFYFQESEVPGIHDYEIVISIIALIGFSVMGVGMGVSQMYWDRTRKVSALLATLAVNRRQIFTARAVMGFLLVLFGPVPVAVTRAIASRTIEPAVTVSRGAGFLFDLWVAIYLFSFLCYCIGLQAGWSSGKIAPTLGAMVLCIILLGLVAIKGVGPDIFIILVLMIVMSLLRAWHTYSKAAL
jgi:hypothetical protein